MNGPNNFEKGNIVANEKIETAVELAKRLQREHQRAYELMSPEQKRIFDARHGGSIFEKPKPRNVPLPKSPPFRTEKDKASGRDDAPELIRDPNDPNTFIQKPSS